MVGLVNLVSQSRLPCTRRLVSAVVEMGIHPAACNYKFQMLGFGSPVRNLRVKLVSNSWRIDLLKEDVVN